MNESAIDFDEMLNKLGGKESGDSMTNNIIMIMMQQNQQAAQAAKEDARRSQEALMAMMMKMAEPKPMDPLTLTLLQSLLGKGGDASESFKQMMEMQRQQAMASQETLKTTLLGVMELKDAAQKDIMERAIESASEGGGGNESTTATILREIRLGLTAAAGSGLLGGAPKEAPAEAQQAALPAPAPAPAHASPAPAAQPQTEGRPAPALMLVRIMRELQQGTAKRPAISRSVIVTLALQDKQLSDAILARDMDQVTAVCVPHVRDDAEVVAWITGSDADGKPISEWIAEYVADYLEPSLRDAMDLPDPDDGEPEELNAKTVTPQVVPKKG